MEEERAVMEPCKLVYYGPQNTMIEQCPIEFKDAFVQSASSMSLGGSINVIIPNAGILQKLYLRFKLKDIPYNAGALAGKFSLTRGWGFGLIDNLQFRLGNSSPYTYYGSQILSLSMVQCENDAKKNQILTLAGPPAQRITTSTGAIVEEAYYSNSNLGSDQSFRFDDAIVPLALPFLSNVRGSAGSGLPIDLSLFDQAITITINLRPLSAIFHGETAATIAQLMSYSASQIEFIGRMGQFKNPSDSLSTVIRMDPSFSYTQFMHVCLGPSENGIISNQNLEGYNNSSSPPRYSVNLVGIPPGSCQCVYIWITKQLDTRPSSLNTAPANLFRFYEMRDVQLYWNGALFVNRPGRSHIMDSAQMHENGGANFPFPITEWNSSTSEFQNGPALISYMFEVNFSALSATEVGPQTMMAGSDFRATQLTVSFTLPANDNSTNPYILNTLYLYNAGVRVSNGGQATFQIGY